MFRQTHPLVCFLPVWFQKELYNLSLFVIPFFFWLCFFWCISLCFQPIFTRFLQLIFCKINFFPLAFSLVTFISVRSMLTRIFVCITDIPVFLYAFLPQDLSCRTVYQISLRISTKYSVFALSSISSGLPYTPLFSGFSSTTFRRTVSTFISCITDA